MRRTWFAVCRIATKENPADLNTRVLSQERGEFLMRRIGLVYERFDNSDRGDPLSREETTTCEDAGEHDDGDKPSRM